MDFRRIKMKESSETKIEITNFSFRKRAKNLYIAVLVNIHKLFR